MMPLAASQLHGFNVLEQPRDSEWFLNAVTAGATEEVRFAFSGGAQTLHVNWGDGNSDDYVVGGTKSHTYAASGSYIVGLSGDIGAIDFYNIGAIEDRLVLPLRWKAIVNRVSGITGLTSLYEAFRRTGLNTKLPANLLDDCTGLTTVGYMFMDCGSLPGPIPDGLLLKLKSLQTAIGLFQSCTSLSSLIPSDIIGTNTAFQSAKWMFRNSGVYGPLPSVFAGCPNLLDVWGCFMRDTVATNGLLTAMPNNYWQGNLLVSEFRQCFYDQTDLAGTAEALWDRVPLPEGVQCWRGCSLLSNYAAIPAYWKTG